MISSHPGIHRHLLQPYSFSHNASGLMSSRRTSPVQQQHMRHPKSGREHLILRFWVHGRGMNEPEGWIQWGKSQIRTAKGYTWDPAVAALQQAISSEPEADPAEESQAMAAPAETSSWGGFFGRLKPQRPTTVSMGKEPPPPGTFKDGEARADYVRVSAKSRLQLPHADDCSLRTRTASTACSPSRWTSHRRHLPLVKRLSSTWTRPTWRKKAYLRAAKLV